MIKDVNCEASDIMAGPGIPKTAYMMDSIRNVVQQIVDGFHPKKVILFGSYATGTPTQDSDVDILVVMDTNQRPLHAAAAIAAAIDHPFPMDILVFRPSDWEEYLSEGAVFATHVSANGLILYEASQAPLPLSPAIRAPGQASKLQKKR